MVTFKIGDLVILKKENTIKKSSLRYYQGPLKVEEHEFIRDLPVVYRTTGKKYGLYVEADSNNFELFTEFELEYV